MFKRTIISALAVAAVTIPTAAQAQKNCAPRDAVVEKLQEKYAESFIGGGLQNSDTLVEIWTSEKSGSFTILVTQASGISCIVSTGQNWNSVVSAAIPEGIAG